MEEESPAVAGGARGRLLGEVADESEPCKPASIL